MPQPGILLNDFIAIDKFPKNVTIKYYFLTHAHSDHYGTIDNKWNNGTIYCSPVTARILPIVTQRLRSKHVGIRSHLVHALSLDVWHHMDGFSVMLLDANHIPGSVMFLFEGDHIPEGRVLFTGDFRADVRLYENVFALSVLREKSLATVYLDTTYINCVREEFPSREASLAEICSVLRNLLFDGSKLVTIVVPKVGREQLLVDIAVQLKRKIWVDYTRFQVAEILGLSEYFTTEKEETSIWTCTKQNIRSAFCDANVYVIDVSMLRHLKPKSVINGERIYNVEYSDHSSPNEIRDFLSQLSFSKVIGLSVPLSQKQMEEFERLGVRGFSDVLIRSETNDYIDENKLSTLASSTIRSRSGIANNCAFDIEILQRLTNYVKKQGVNRIGGSVLNRDEENTNIICNETMFEANILIRNLQNTRLSDEITTKSEKNLQKTREDMENAESLRRTIDDESDYNLEIKKIMRDEENLIAHISRELNNNENAEDDDPLHEFFGETNISNEVENLDSFSEKYCEAVSTASKTPIVGDILCNVEECVFYDTSRGTAPIDISAEGLDKSGKIDESVLLELE